MERALTFFELFGQIIVMTSDVQVLDGTGRCVSLVNRNNVGNSITRIDDDTSGTTRCIERQNCRDGDMETGYVEDLEHNFGHSLPVMPGVRGNFVSLPRNIPFSSPKLIVEGVGPDLFHAIPVGYDATLDRALESQYITFGPGFVALSEFSGREYYPTDTDTYPT